MADRHQALRGTRGRELATEQLHYQQEIDVLIVIPRDQLN